METRTHCRLANVAVRLLIAEGFTAAAREVLCPIARFRVDVAGYLGGRRTIGSRAGSLRIATPEFRHDGKPCPQTIVVECKQSRADFLRDAASHERLFRMREAVRTRMAQLEERLVKPREPHLRRTGQYLFSELEAWEFFRSRSLGYQRAAARMRAIELRLYGHVKFWTMRRYLLASHMYILAPAGLIRSRELPSGWGLLECPGAVLRAGRAAWSARAAAEQVRIVTRSVVMVPRADFSQRMLRNIAVAATRSSLRHGDASPIEAQPIRSTSLRTPAANAMNHAMASNSALSLFDSGV